jgi:nucleotide-binding universal stress UspA family protein
MSILPKSILVPTDFSEPAERALDYAVALAERVGAQVTVLHAYEIPLVGFPDGALVATADIAGRIVRAAQEGLDVAVAQRKSHGVGLKSLLKTGDAREVIEAIAQDLGADLIVMGTHGRRGLSRALLGSVTEYVVRTATCPVLAVHGQKG